MNSFMLTWKHYGHPCLIDFDDEDQALAAAVLMAELASGRTDIHVSAVPYEETPEDSERKARVWARVQERIHNVPVVFR